MLNHLLLLSGNDIPFVEAKVVIHQPTLKEIAYIGEDKFFIGCGLLDFSKKMLTGLDKDSLSNYDDFEILMSVMTDKSQLAKDVKETIEAAKMILNLVFPLYTVDVRKDCIALKQGQQEFFINKKNYSSFKNILIEMFNLHLNKESTEEYNPSGSLSQKIAEKFKKRHETLLKIKSESSNQEKKSIKIFSRYVSILAVGEQKSMCDLMHYTVYQLLEEFQRFQLKVQWDGYIQARMAGAQDLDEVDNWMIDLQDQGKNKTNKNKIT